MTRLGLLLLSMGILAPEAGVAQVDDRDREVLAVLDAFLVGWNSRDANRYADALHFPHVILNAGSAGVYESRDQYTALGDRHWATVPAQWSHTEWRTREILQRIGDVVHVAGTWARINHEGEVFHTADVLYVVVYKDERWGIQARSGNRWAQRSPSATSMPTAEVLASPH